jgi:ADP-ribose pyrophosphatase
MTLRLPDAFHFCPKCGQASESTGQNPFNCTACGFRFFFGPTVAVGGIVTNDAGEVLFLERARDPGRGQLGIPGGFVDEGEDLETALVREVFEETQLHVLGLRYLTTLPNTYPYKGILYPVADVFYECHVASFDNIVVQPGEIQGYFFRVPTSDILDKMAFASNRRAIEFHLQSLQKPIAWNNNLAK